jgi:hypothetical protein
MGPVPTHRWAQQAQPYTRLLHQTCFHRPAPAHQARGQEAEAAEKAEQGAMAKQKSKAAAAAATHEPAISKPKPKPVHEWTIDDVSAFFSAQKLGEYNAAIAENEVDGNMLQELAAQNGLDELGIKSKLHVIRIEAALAKAAAVVSLCLCLSLCVFLSVCVSLSLPLSLSLSLRLRLPLPLPLPLPLSLSLRSHTHAQQLRS